MAFTEGTANDWLAVGFVDGYGVPAAAGALVFGVFVTAMTVGRTAGTVALDRLGSGARVLATMAAAAPAPCSPCSAGTLWLAVAGVALWGLGTSLGFPVGDERGGGRRGARRGTDQRRRDDRLRGLPGRAAARRASSATAWACSPRCSRSPCCWRRRCCSCRRCARRPWSGARTAPPARTGGYGDQP